MFKSNNYEVILNELDVNAIRIKNNKIIKNTFPIEAPDLNNDFIRIFLTDKNNIGIGCLQYAQGDSRQYLQLLMQSKETNDDPDIDNIWRGISIRLDSDGTFTIDGVTPILESYGDELVTANWVRQLLASKGIN